jgi:hypothetical protein
MREMALLDLGIYPGAQAMFNFPSGITLDPNETVYVADNQNSRSGHSWWHCKYLAGTGDVGFMDGDAKPCKIQFPFSLDIDGQGNLL